jgi:hypothetical protein
VRRCIALALTILATTTIFAGILATSPGAASATRAGELESQLRNARRDLQAARQSLGQARAGYRLFQATGATRGSGWYLSIIRYAKTRVGTLQRRVEALRRKVAARHQSGTTGKSDWMPLVRQVAAQNDISAAGLYRLMSLESGGRATACNGAYHGLFQYCYSTWDAAWNPWRERSIYDGEAQIRATARAINRGWGSHLWPATYPMAF